MGELEDLQCFGEFDVSGRAKTMKIGRRVRDLYIDLIKSFSPILQSGEGAEGRGKIRENEVFLTYEWAIGS